MDDQRIDNWQDKPQSRGLQRIIAAARRQVRPEEDYNRLKDLEIQAIKAKCTISSLITETHDYLEKYGNKNEEHSE